MQLAKSTLGNTKLHGFLIVFLLSLSAVYGVSVTDSSQNFEVSEQTETGNWTIYFNSSPGSLRAQKILSPQSFSFSTLQHFDQETQSWVPQPTNTGPQGITANWTDEYPYGRIVYSVEKFDRYGVNLTVSGESAIAENPGRPEQRESQLNLSSPRFLYELCAFTSGFDRCNPLQQGRSLPGTEPDRLRLDKEGGRDISLPSSSSIVNFSVDLSSADDREVAGLSGSLLELGRLDPNSDTDIAVANNDELRLYTDNLTSPTRLSFGSDITGLEIANAKPLEDGKQVFVSSDNGLFLANYSGSKKWRIGGSAFSEVSSAQLSSNRRRYSSNDGEAEGFQCLGCADNSTVFTLPYSIEGQRNSYFVVAGLNFYNRSSDLALEINGTEYDVDESEITTPAEETAVRDSGFDRAVAVGEQNFSTSSFVPDIRGEHLSLLLPVSKRSGASGSLSVSFNESRRQLSPSQTISVRTNTSVAVFDALSPVERGGASRKIEFDLNETQDTYVGFALNRDPGESRDLLLNTGQQTYEIDGDQVSETSIDVLSDDDLEADDSVQIRGQREAVATLDYNVSEINAQQLYIQSSLAFAGSKSGDLKLSVGGENYDVKESKIRESNNLSFSINDGSYENESCIGCGVNSAQNDGNYPSFELGDVGIPERVPAKKAEIEAPICYVGQKVDDLVLKDDGSGGLSGESYDVNVSGIPECGTGIEPTSVEVNASDLAPDYIRYVCGSCNESAFYNLKGDDSTDGQSRFFNRSSGDYDVNLTFDYAINITSNSALKFTNVSTPVDTSDVAEDGNVTYFCEGCDSSNYYRLLQDSSSELPSYYSSSGVDALQDGLMTRVFTNSSLEHSFVYQRVEPQNIENEFVNLSCPNCTEGYNLMRNSSAAGPSFRDGSSVAGDFGIKVEQRPTKFDPIDIPLNSSSVNQTFNLTFSCDECAEESFFVGSGTSGSLPSLISAGSTNTEFTGATPRFFTNSSLKFDKVRTQVNESDLQNGENVTFFCRGGCNGRSYGFPLDEDDGTPSYAGNTSFDRLEGSLIVEVLALGSNPGKEVIATKFPAVVQARSSSSKSLWNYTLSSQPYDISSGDVDSQTGTEIQVATRSGVVTLDSTGSKVDSYPETDTWYRSVTTLNVSDHPGVETVGGTNSGNVVAFDTTGTKIWETSLGSYVSTLISGDITPEPGREVAAGLDSGKVVILNSRGTPITEYSSPSSILDLGQGNVSTAPGEELGLAADRISFLPVQSAPTNLSIDIGDDGSAETSNNGTFRGSQTFDSQNLENSVSSLLQTCSGSAESECRIPVSLSSSEPALVNLDNLSIYYRYNLSRLVDSEQVTKWSQTTNFDTGKQLNYRPLEISYEPTEIPVRVGSLTSLVLQREIDSEREVKFNSERFNTSGTPIDLDGNRLQYFITTLERRSPDYIWYKNQTKEAPVVKETNTTGFNETVTVRRNSSRTSVRFRNISVSGELDSEVVRQQFLEVDWDRDGEYTNITPSGFCGSLEPETADGQTFFACRQDADEDGVVDGFRWVHPYVGTSLSENNRTLYRLGGQPPENRRPVVNSFNVSQRDFWGSVFNFSANLTEPEGELVNTTLYIDIGNGFNAVGQQTNSTPVYRIDSFKNWSSNSPVEVKLQYQDVRPSNLSAVNTPKNTSVVNQPIERHDTRLEYVSGGGIEVDRKGEVWNTRFKAVDAVTGERINSDVFCGVKLFEGDEGNVLNLERPNATGFCDIETQGLDFSVGPHNWTGIVGGFQFYKDSESDRRNVTLIGNYTFNSSFNARTLFRPDDKPNSSVEYNITSIRGLFGTQREAPYEIRLLVSGGDDILLDQGSADGGNISGRFNLRDTEKLGERQIELLLTNSTQGSLSYFNDRRETFNFTVLGVLNSTLNSPDPVLAEGDNTVNLTANITNSLGSGVAPEVDFVTPKGICENIFTGERTFTCEFDPSNDLSAREYNWSINASKDFYRHEDTTATVEVSRGLEANLSIANNSVYRYNNSNKTSNLAYNLSEISDGSGPVDQVSYSVFWSGEQVKAGTTDSNGFNDSFDVPLSTPVGDTELRVELSKQGFQATNITESATVFGSLNISANNDATVFLNNSQTRESNLALTTFLNISVTDRTGTPIQDFDASFTKPPGACSFSSSPPRYSCSFNPSVAADEGSRNWSATVTKDLYQTDATSNREVLIKNLVRPQFEASNPQVVRKSSENVTAQVVTPDGDTVASGFNATLEVGNQSAEQPLSSAGASIEYSPQCDVLPGAVDANATIEDLSRIYDVFEQTANGEVDVIEDVSSDITSPLDRSDPQARNYRRGETVDLSAQITDSCGPLNSSASFDVVWEAEDRDTSSIIASSQESSWTIPDEFSGNTNVSVRVEGEYYRNGTDQNTVLIDRVINSRITGGLRPRTRKFGGDRKFLFNATIVTGNGLKAYKSSIEENWSEFNFTFFVGGDRLQEVSTDENGTATANLSLGPAFDPGQKNIKARLENTSEINTTIFDQNDSDQFRLLEEVNLSILRPSDANISFKESVNLSSSLSTPTDSKPSLQPNYTWTYQDSDDDPRQISSGPNSSFVAPSYVFGEGFINVSVNGEFLTPDTDSVATIGKRNVSIESTEIPRFVQIDKKNLVNTTIDVEGLSDISGLSAAYSLGDVARSATSNSSGNIQIEVNGSNFERGAYDSVLSLDNPDSRFLELAEPSAEPKTVVVPNYLNVSAYWRDNNENILGTVKPDDEDGDNFPNLPNKTVYRNPGPFDEPDTLFLGANISTVFAETGENLPVDLANVSFYIQGTSAEGDQVSERITSCPTNLTEFEAQQNDDRDTWFDDFTCDTSWNPRPGFPVGDYTLTINSTRPEPGWRAEQIQIPVEVRGVLNVSVTEPDPGQDDFQMDNLTLNAEITDRNGNEFSNEDLDVYWSLDEDGCNSGGNRGIRNGGEVINWDDAIAHGDRNSIFTWIIPGNPSNNGYNLGGGEDAWIDVEKEYFEETRTESRPDFDGGCSNIGSRNDRAEVRHDLRARIETSIASPSTSPVETNDRDILNVTADFSEFNTSQKLPNGFDGTYTAECIQCTSGENDPDTNPELIQNDDAVGDDSEALFQFNFSGEEYGENYTFRVNVTNSDSDYEGVSPFDSDSVEVVVFRDLGSGEGSVDINGICEPEKGEDVESAPADCGFDNLPERFHLNQTAQDSSNQTQFNQFINESSDLFEAGVEYYANHTSYPSEGAGGCDFNGLENSTYEDQDFCPDTFDTNGPPDIKNSRPTKQYVKPSGTSLRIKADVRDTDGNLNIVDATDTSTGDVIDFLSSTSSSTRTFTGFTSDPLDFSSDTTVRISANDTQGASTSATLFQIKEDPNNVSISSVSLEGSGTYAEGEEVSLEVSLANADNPDPQPDTVKNVTAEGGALSYDASTDTWKGSFIADSSKESVVIKANEIAGYFDRETRTYTVDTTSPTVSNELVNGSLVSPGTLLEFTADITDNALQSTRLEFSDGTVFCDNSTFSRETGDTFTCEKPAPDSTGSFTFVFFANDTVGNEDTSKTVQVDVDGNPPTISSLSASDNFINSGSTVELSADITDNEGNLDATKLIDSSSSLRCPDSDFTDDGSGTFTCQQQVSTTTQFRARANDTIGNEATSSPVTVTVDDTSPQISINEPAPGVFGGEIDLNASIDDPNLRISSPQAKLEDGTSNVTVDLSQSGAYWTGTVDTTQVSDGPHSLYVTASDKADNKDAASVQIETDNTRPDIAVDTPTEGSNLNGEFFFNVTATDANLNDSTAAYKIQGSDSASFESFGSPSNSGQFSALLDTANSGPGQYTLVAKVEDKAGNQETSSVSVTFDENPPEVSILDPANGSFVRQNVTVRANITDAAGNGDQTTYECQLGGLSYRQMQPESVTGSNGIFVCQVNSTQVGDGSTGIRVRANDSFGQRQINFTEVVVDNTPPDADTVSINTSIAADSTQIAVNVTTPGDNGDSLSYVEVDGSSNLSYDQSSSKWRGLTQGGADSNNVIDVLAVDLAGNIGRNTTVTYNLDNTPPDISLLQMNASFVSSGDIIALESRATDNSTASLGAAVIDEESLISAEELNLINTQISDPDSDGKDEELQKKWYYDSTTDIGENLSNGNYSFRVNSSDTVKNSDSLETQEFVVDNKPPTIDTAKLNGTPVRTDEDIVVQSGTPLEVTATITEEFVYRAIANSQRIGSSNSVSGILAADSAANPIQLTVEDRSNNTASTQLPFVIDDEKPSIASVNSNASFGVTRSDATLRLEANVSDPNIASVQFNGSSTFSQSGLNVTDIVPSNRGCPAGEEDVGCLFQLNATDRAGNTNLSNVSVQIDDVVPRAGNLTSNATVIQPGEFVRFSAQARDPNLLNTTITNSTGQVCELSPAGSAVFNCTVRIGTTGSYTLQATDKAGNLNESSSTNIEVDAEPPHISQFESNATFGVSRSDRMVNLSARISDTNFNKATINSTEMSKSGDLFTVIASPSNLGCPEPQAQCTLQLVANDTAGNQQNRSIDLGIDDIKPDVSNVDSSKSVVPPNGSLSLRVNVSGESNTTLNKVEAEKGNLSWNGSVWTGAVEIDNDGFVNVTASDFAPNKGTNSSVEYEVDDLPPRLSDLNSNATFDSSQSDRTLNFTVQAVDENLADINLVNKSGGGNLSMNRGGPETFFAAATPSSLGCPVGVNNQSCTVQAQATDAAGNENSTAYRLNIDDVNPDINNVSIGSSFLRPDADVLVEVNVSGESNSQIRSVSAESESLSFSSGVWTSVVQVDNDGIVNVTAEDYASNTDRNETVEYVVDRKPPNASNLTSNSTDDVERSDTALNITLSASDAVRLDSVKVEGLNATRAANDTFFLVEPPSGLGCTEGVCTIDANVTDVVGRTNSTTYQIKIDDTRPQPTGFEAVNASEGNPDEAIPDSFLKWRANFSDASNISVEIFATNRTSSRIIGNRTDMSKISDNTFGTIKSPLFFNTSNGTFQYKARATDIAGNVRNSTYKLKLRVKPPEINETEASDPLPQEDRQQILVTTNVTDTNAVLSVNMTINGSGQTVTEEPTLIEENPGNLTGGVYGLNFTPTESGTYNVNVSAVDTTEQEVEVLFEEVFRAVGKTTGDLKLEPRKRVFNNITVFNSSSLTLNTRFNNTGLATAYGASLSRISAPNGVRANATVSNCGDLQNGSGCSKTTSLTVSADSKAANLSVVSSAAWTNPDGSQATASNVTLLEVLPNPVLEERGTAAGVEVDFNESTAATNISVFSAGNVELRRVKTEVSQTALPGKRNLFDDEYGFSKTSFNVSVNQTVNSTFNVKIGRKGSFGVRLEANATGNECSSECVDTRELGIDVFKRANVELLNSSGQVARDPVLLEAKVTDEFQNPVDNYNVSFLDNGTVIDSSNTSGEGLASVVWNATQEPPGFHNLSVSISENRSRFFKTNRSLDSETVKLTDQLSLERNVSEREIFWYDTQDPHFTVFNYSLRDRNNFPVNTSISLFTNATGTFEKKSSCLTGPDGRCSILYNASVNGPVGALAVSNASKRFFNDTSSLEDFIDVVGGFSVAIESPQGGLRPALDTDVIRGRAQTLEASVKNENGTSVDADVNWTLNGTKIGENKTFDWSVPQDLEYGFYTLTASTRNNQTVTNDTVGVNVYDPVQLVALNSTKPVIKRNETFVVEAQVNNTRNNTPVSDYTCRMFDGEQIRNTTQTDEDGRCDLAFNASRERVGNHTLTVDIPEVTEGQFYLPVNSTEVFEIDVQEKLNIKLLRPENRINRYINISLNSTVRDRYGQVDADVNWTLDGRQVSRGEDGYWLPRNETTVGAHNLTATATKQFFTPGNDSEKLTVFGWADTDLQTPERVLRGQSLNITTRITDSNTSEPVENHPVDLFISREGSQPQPAGNQTTGSAGFANLSLSTANRQPGLYEIQMKAGDNSSTFYNVTDKLENRSVELLGKLNLSLDTNQSLVYRNGFAKPQSTGLQLNTTDSKGKVNASFNVTSGQQAVASGFTGEDGTSNLVYNPENLSIGRRNITATVSLDNYTSPEPATSRLTVRTSILPVWTNDDDTSYNFSTKRGINVTANIDEGITEKPIPRYPFEAFFGKRNATYSANFTQEWKNEGSGILKATDDALFISNTTAGRSLELEGKTRLRVEAENVTTNWSFGYRNEDWETPIKTTTNESATVSIDETPINEINISSTGNLTVTRLRLSDTTLEERYALGERKYLGYNTSEVKDNGQLDDSRVRNNLSACRGNPGCETIGWYAGDTLGTSDSIEASVARGVFGSTGTELNITDLSPGAAVRAKYIASPNTSLNLSNATHIAFWLDTNLTSSVNLETGSGCQISRGVDRHEGFSLRQVKIDDAAQGCGLLENLSIEFENSGSFSKSSVSRLDEVYVLEETSTGLNGSEILNWRPPSANTWSFKLVPESKNFHNISSDFAFTDIQVLTGGGGESAADRTTVGDLKANATTFEIEQPEFNRTVASSTFGVIGSVRAENLLEGESVELNITETTDTGLLRQDSFKLAPSEERDLDIRYNSTSPGNFSITGAVFNPNTRRSEEINITLRVRDVAMEIASLKSQNGARNVTAGDNIQMVANIRENGTGIAQEVSWNSSVQGVPCASTTSRYIGSGNWSVNCTAPEIPNNPINTTLLLEASHDNLVIRDSRELKYRDVTPPFIVSSTTENVAEGENSSVSGTIGDNAGVSNASVRVVYLPNASTVQTEKSIGIEGFSFEFTETIYRGDYNVVVSASDTANNTANFSLPVSVNPPKNITGELDGVSARVELKRPETGATLKQSGRQENGLDVDGTAEKIRCGH